MKSNRLIYANSPLLLRKNQTQLSKYVQFANLNQKLYNIDMISRQISQYLQKISHYYPVIMLTGPRQSGKTTLVKSLFAEKTYLSLEDIDNRQFATEDPRGFLNQLPQGAIIDEAQYVPTLFSYIQTRVDKHQQLAEFILTGSQNFLLLEKVSQSLAGRAGIAHLLPFSLKELQEANIQDKNDLDQRIFNGFYPRIYDLNIEPNDWYKSYVNTYIERDIRQIKNVQNLSKFQLFIRLCAGRIGQLLNLSSLATECGVNHSTIQSWLSILEASFLIFRLQPYHKNFNKRLVKQAKLYFYDTGLACYLLGISQSTQLHSHYLKGSLFENFIIADLIKKQFNQGKDPNFYFWRDNHGHEIDLLIEQGEDLLPIEIKSGATITKDFFKPLNFWLKLSNITKGYLIYTGKQSQVRNNIDILSWHDLSQLDIIDLKEN